MSNGSFDVSCHHNQHHHHDDICASDVCNTTQNYADALY